MPKLVNYVSGTSGGRLEKSLFLKPSVWWGTNTLSLMMTGARVKNLLPGDWLFFSEIVTRERSPTRWTTLPTSVEHHRRKKTAQVPGPFEGCICTCLSQTSSQVIFLFCAFSIWGHLGRWIRHKAMENHTASCFSFQISGRFNVSLKTLPLP